MAGSRQGKGGNLWAWQGDRLEGRCVLPGGGAGSTRILGIDPGTRVMGFGVVEGDGRGPARLVAVGSFRVQRAGADYARLLATRECVLALIARYAPREAAIEAPFFGKNAQSMLKLGRAQGVAIAAMAERGLEVQEYAPRKVKIAVAGHGEANKEQVRRALELSYRGEGLEALEDFDSTDALAVALCHYYAGRSVGRTGKGSWSDFVAKNPERVRE